MEGARGEHCVMDVKFDRDRSFDEVAQKAFRNVPITEVWVGADLAGSWTNCTEAPGNPKVASMPGRQTVTSSAIASVPSILLVRKVSIPYPVRTSAAVEPDPIGMTVRQFVDRLRSMQGATADLEQDGDSGFIVCVSELDQITRKRYEFDFELGPHPAVGGLVVRRLIIDGTEFPRGDRCRLSANCLFPLIHWPKFVDSEPNQVAIRRHDHRALS